MGLQIVSSENNGSRKTLNHKFAGHIFLDQNNFMEKKNWSRKNKDNFTEKIWSKRIFVSQKVFKVINICSKKGELKNPDPSNIGSKKCGSKTIMGLYKI